MIYLTLCDCSLLKRTNSAYEEENIVNHGSLCGQVIETQAKRIGWFIRRMYNSLNKSCYNTGSRVKAKKLCAETIFTGGYCFLSHYCKIWIVGQSNLGQSLPRENLLTIFSSYLK